jgi:hypothetical protein
MFENAAPIDLRSCTAIRLWVRADRPRKVRFSLAPSDSLLKVAADTGVSFGRDTTVGAEWTEWNILVDDLAWPKWAAVTPSARRDELMSRVFAIQFDIGCEAKDGVCKDDSGFVEVDNIVIQGVGGRWKDPVAGDCTGDTLWIDRFQSGNLRQNDQGGWWYAYTDRTSQDSASRGSSKVLNASSPDSASTWNGPDPDSGAALHFQLQRAGVYSGYATIETQLTEPDEQSQPRARSFTGARAISFDIRFAKDFSEDMGGVLVHLRKKGRLFDKGRDHQLQIPVDTVQRRWCVDLKSFKQPNWSEWIEDFSPDSLLALSFEVKLPAFLDISRSAFRVSDIAFHGEMETGARRSADRRMGRVRRDGGVWIYHPSGRMTGPIHWRLVSLSGRKIGEGVTGRDAQSVLLPGGWKGVSVLHIQADGRSEAFSLTQP